MDSHTQERTKLRQANPLSKKPPTQQVAQVAAGECDPYSQPLCSFEQAAWDSIGIFHKPREGGWERHEKTRVHDIHILLFAICHGIADRCRDSCAHAYAYAYAYT